MVVWTWTLLYAEIFKLGFLDKHKTTFDEVISYRDHYVGPDRPHGVGLRELHRRLTLLDLIGMESLSGLLFLLVVGRQSHHRSKGYLNLVVLVLSIMVAAASTTIWVSGAFLLYACMIYYIIGYHCYCLSRLRPIGEALQKHHDALGKIIQRQIGIHRQEENG